MTVCAVCGGDQFTLIDGFYYCDECNTQSQDIREITNEDNTMGLVMSVRNSRVQVSEATRDAKRRRRERRREMRKRVIITYEQMLNLVLKRWTDAVIRLGVPAQVAAGATKLWSVCVERVLTDQSLSLRHLGVHNGVVHTVKQKRKHHLFVSHLLVMLWLALHDLDRRYLLSDLQRWAREGLVPVYSSFNELPEDITIGPHLSIRFPKSGHLGNQLARARALLHAMSLPPLTRPPRLSYLLARFVDELALPRQLVTFTLNLCRDIAIPDHKVREAFAVAALLLALKVLLRLDDATELCCSAAADWRNRREPTGARWFSLTDWLRYSRERLALVARHHYPTRQYYGVGNDPCRRGHRNLLYQFYRRDGFYRLNAEGEGNVKTRTPCRMQYGERASTLFPDLQTLPDDSVVELGVCDPLRPLSSRLEEALRLGPEERRRRLTTAGHQLRSATLDYLLDEQPARQLDLPVQYGAARNHVRPPSHLFCRGRKFVLIDDGEPTSAPATRRHSVKLRSSASRTVEEGLGLTGSVNTADGVAGSAETADGPVGCTETAGAVEEAGSLAGPVESADGQAYSAEVTDGTVGSAETVGGPVSSAETAGTVGDPSETADNCEVLHSARMMAEPDESVRGPTELDGRSQEQAEDGGAGEKTTPVLFLADARLWQIHNSFSLNPTRYALRGPRSYVQLAERWPENYRCILELFAATVEMLPSELYGYALDLELCVTKRIPLAESAGWLYGEVAAQRGSPSRTV